VIENAPGSVSFAYSDPNKKVITITDRFSYVVFSYAEFLAYGKSPIQVNGFSPGLNPVGDTPMSKKGMLLVGHGSTMPYNQELVEKTAAMIQAKNGDYIVKCGFMNMNKPTIKESMEAFKKEQIDALVVVPLFLAKGVHIEKDIPGEIGLPEGVKKGAFQLNGKSIPLVYADPIGSDPLLADLMVKNANKALTL
jgi:cobalamin biosynthesis Co2+ chelatase CbiK